LCPQTNTFYAFETEEEYLAFMDWLETESKHKDVDTAPSTPNEEEEMSNFESATNEIMKIFLDPMFEENQEETILEEVDF
jgi:hypothetical protein